MSNEDRARREEPVTHTSVERKDGDRVGFSGGENLHGVEEFSGRPNVTEERESNALPADGSGDEHG
jgi:hypothetical protein